MAYDPMLMMQFMQSFITPAQQAMMAQMSGFGGYPTFPQGYGFPPPPPSTESSYNPTQPIYTPMTAASEQPIPEEVFQRMVGPSPMELGVHQWNRWYQGDKGQGEKDLPVPKWDGKFPASRLKPWLKELRMMALEDLLY